MRMLFRFLFLFFSLTPAYGQNRWTFLKGNDVDRLGVYDTPGLTDKQRAPACRSEALTWQLNGVLYMFGGFSYEHYSTYIYNDFWAFDTLTKIWTKISGNTETAKSGNYGTKGLPALTNYPGARSKSITWVAGGKLYLFGGNIIDASSVGGVSNDLWEYNPVTGLWVWLKGSQFCFQTGIYGTLGVANSANTPGARHSSSGCVLGNKFYLIGGTSSLDNFNDVWEYDVSTNNWTWIKGSSSGAKPARYNSRGFESALNQPPPLKAAATWLADSMIYTYSGNALNTLWRFNLRTNNWVWLKGDTSIYTIRTFWGEKNIEDSLNQPPPISNSGSWSDSNYFYLLGGANDFARNAMWKYDIKTNIWTWIKGDSTKNTLGIYGIENIETSENCPGARLSMQLWSVGSKVYLLGGYGYDMFGRFGITEGTLNDLWEYNTLTNNWTWRNGLYNTMMDNISEIKGRPSYLNNPGAKLKCAQWQKGDTIYVMGGRRFSAADPSDDILWAYSISMNEWWVEKESSSKIPIYGTKGLSSPSNTPGVRIAPFYWTYNNKFYLWGGHNLGTKYKNDLWEYNPSTKEWTWINGSDVDNPMPSKLTGSSIPGGRSNGVQFVLNDTIYIYGGDGIDSTGNEAILNDLWRFDFTSNNWVWLKGAIGGNQYTQYGTMGIPSPSNKPGSRRGSTGVTYNGKIYMYGGYGLPKYVLLNAEIYVNDLWSYDPSSNNWTWVKGDDVMASFYGNYGTKGISNVSNRPEGREGANSWVEGDKMYLCNGYIWNGARYIPGGTLNSFWEFDFSSKLWTWVSGNQSYNYIGKLNTKYKPDSTNIPGARSFAKVIPYNNRIYLFGGAGFSCNNDYINLENRNDVWSYEMCNTPISCYSKTPKVIIGANGISSDTLYQCNPEPLFLNAGNTGCSFLWNTGDTMQYCLAKTPGVYWVTVTNTLGLSSSDTVTVLSGTMPKVKFPKDTTFCEGFSAKLDAKNPGATYLWNLGDTSSEILVNTTGVYSVTIWGMKGCATKNSISVIVNPSPKIELGNDTNFCDGKILKLDAENIGSNYLWNTGAVTRTVNVTISGKYLVTVTNKYNCTDSDSINVLVNPKPLVMIGTDTTICRGDSLVLDAENIGSRFIWNTGDTTQKITVDSTGYYFVTVTDTFGCFNKSDIVISLFEKGFLSIGADTSVCPETNLNLNAEYPKAKFYLWNTGSTSPSIAVANKGDYSVIVTDSNNCSIKDTIRIDNFKQPNVDLGGDTLFCLGDSIVLDARNSGSQYLWSTSEATKSIIVKLPGKYYIQLSDTNQCQAVDTILVDFYPKLSVDSIGIIVSDTFKYKFKLEGLKNVKSVSWYIDSIKLSSNESFEFNFKDYDTVDVWAILNNECVSDTVFKKIELARPININMRSFTIIPNPIGEKLTIHGEGVEGIETQIKIFNVLGVVVSIIEHKWDESDFSIDAKMLNPGIYQLLIHEMKGEQKFVLKFLKL